MSKDEKELFRYRLIAPLLDPDLMRGDKKAIFKAVSEKIHLLPSGKEVKFSPETIRSWYKRFRKRGFDGLKTKTRSDIGKSRTVSEEIIRKACDLKIEVPGRTISKVIDILERENIVKQNTLKKSTLHRIFQQHHITSRVPKEKGYWQRFQAEFPNDLWQSDEMAGPYLLDPNNPDRKIRTKLLGFLDDNSRVITHSQFFFEAKLPNLEHCLRKGIQKMGLPKKIYVDNGSIYSSKHLASVCAHLGIHLMFARPYSPQGKGKIEAFWKYVRSSFLTEVSVSGITTLQQLNEAFRAWLELMYQRKIHSEIKAKPIDVFMAHKDKIRYPADEELKEAFLSEEHRNVHKDCTFQLMSNYYEVMPALKGHKIQLRFDPDDLEVVKVYLAGDFFQQAKILRMPPQRRKKQAEQSQKTHTGINYLKRLVDEHQDLKENFLFGPKVTSDNRFTVSDLLSVLQRKGFHMADFEKKEVQKYFDNYGPFDRDLTLKTLENIINLKGTKQHISFYLEKIVEIKRRKSS